MTYHGTLERCIDEDLLKNHASWQLYTEIATKMNDGFFARTYIDLFLQHCGHHRYNVYGHRSIYLMCKSKPWNFHVRRRSSQEELDSELGNHRADVVRR